MSSGGGPGLTVARRELIQLSQHHAKYSQRYFLLCFVLWSLAKLSAAQHWLECLELTSIGYNLSLMLQLSLYSLHYNQTMSLHTILASID